MKKLFALLTILILAAALLCACGCDHAWEEADCNDPKTCTKCGATEGEELGHDYVDASCESPKTCARCDKTRGEALGHTWEEATCASPKTCAVCGKTEGEALSHTWQDATCDTPKTCTKCAATEGEALGHTWQDATCLAPKTCSVCAATEGEVAEHAWQAATCEAPKTCSVCAAIEGEALGHAWVDATYEAPKTCSNCGKTEGEPLAKPTSAGLGMDMATFHGALESNMKQSGYLQTTTYLGTSDDGTAVYEVFDTAGVSTGAYLMYTFCADGVTVDSFIIYTENGNDSATSKLCGAYLGSAMVVVDLENAQTIYTNFLSNSTIEGNKATYYTEFDGIGYLMMVEVNDEGKAELTCAVTPIE